MWTFFLSSLCLWFCMSRLIIFLKKYSHVLTHEANVWEKHFYKEETWLKTLILCKRHWFHLYSEIHKHLHQKTCIGESFYKCLWKWVRFFVVSPCYIEDIIKVTMFLIGLRPIICINIWLLVLWIESKTLLKCFLSSHITNLFYDHKQAASPLWFYKVLLCTSGNFYFLFLSLLFLF